MLKETLATLLVIIAAVISFGPAARAQETELATESRLLEVSVPANAQRVAAASVPAEIDGMFEKVVAAGKGKFRRGDSEVLLWSGAGYRRANAPALVGRLTGAIRKAGWQFSVAGEENGVTAFTAMKESPRRAVFGIYGVTDEALVLVATELLPEDGVGAADVQSRRGETGVGAAGPATSRSGASIVGTWGDGYSSIWVTRTPEYGPVSKTPGRSHLFEYKFHPDGTFEFVSVMQMTTYSCTTSYFNDKRGRYTIDGDRLTLTLSKNFWRQQNGRAPSSNKEMNYKLDPETYTFRVRRNDRGREEVCLDSGSGNGEACYERKQE